MSNPPRTLSPGIDYHLFDPSPCGFAQPRVPLLPVLTPAAVAHRAAAGNFELIGRGLRHAPYLYGRYALREAYRLAGVGPDGSLLVPAYHCRTMLDPAISLGSEPVLYPLTPQLAPALGTLRERVAHARRPVRAMLLTHYFGFAQDPQPVKAFCDQHGIQLIEDCSHAIFNLRGRERLGLQGAYTVVSPYKFFPCEVGGLLFAAPGAALGAAPDHSAGLLAELRTLVGALGRGLAHRSDARRLAADLAALGAQVGAIVAAPSAPALERQARLSDTSPMYRAAEQGVASPVVSRWLTRLCDIGHIALRRRANFERWLQATRELPHCRALYDTLPPHCVPYMFPLLIDEPETHFPVLKRLGVPIWRWDEMARSDCPVSTAYRTHLLHLPCHQSLTDTELAWMIAAVTRVVRDVPAGA